MNVFYIPGLGYIYNKKIWLRFEKLVEHLYNQYSEPQLLVTIYDEDNEMDQFNKAAWTTCLTHAGVKYEDA